MGKRISTRAAHKTIVGHTINFSFCVCNFIRLICVFYFILGIQCGRPIYWACLCLGCYSVFSVFGPICLRINQTVERGLYSVMVWYLRVGHIGTGSDRTFSARVKHKRDRRKNILDESRPFHGDQLAGITHCILESGGFSSFYST